MRRLNIVAINFIDITKCINSGHPSTTPIVLFVGIWRLKVDILHLIQTSSVDTMMSVCYWKLSSSPYSNFCLDLHQMVLINLEVSF